MGLKNTSALRDAGCEMATYLLAIGHGLFGKDKDPEAIKRVAKWQKERDKYEELMSARRDKKNRKQEAKKLAKARGENK